jgi:hypothetical protein
MTSEATLDVPTPYSTTKPEPQQSAVAAQNFASPTLPPSSQESSQSEQQLQGTGSMDVGPTAALETQTPQLTTPGGDLTATDSDTSFDSDHSQSSDTPSSNAGEAGSTTSGGVTQVFPADLYSLVFSCLLLICLAW